MKAPKPCRSVFSVQCSVFGKVLLVAFAFLLTACGGPRAASGPSIKRDAYYHRVITSGHAAFQRGDLSRAAELYENGLVRAQVMDRPAEIGASAYNLALCRVALGDLEQGRELLREARMELRRAGESGVDTLIAEAEVERRLGDNDAAWNLTDEVLASLRGIRAREWRIQTHALRALIALDRDDHSVAEEELSIADGDVQRTTPLRLRARIAEGRGELFLARGEVLPAAKQFDSEAMFYRDEGRYTDMVRALVRAGAAYQAGSDHWMAADRYHRAARHYAAHDRTVEALRTLERALPSLEEIDDPLLARRVALLFENLAESVKISEE